jgi:hypothetical protein
VTVPVTAGVTVKVVALTVATFMASLKVAITTELGQTPSASFGGTIEITVGGVKAGILLRSGSPHPETKMSVRNARNQTLRVFCLLTSLAFPRDIAPRKLQETPAMDSVECGAQLTRNFRDCSCRPHDWAVGVSKGETTITWELVARRSTAKSL